MVRVVTYNEIDRAEWSRLVQTSATGTWFQTPEAYDFFALQPELFKPFVVAISNDASLSEAQQSINSSLQMLRGVCVGYVTVERNPIKQYFTRRAIIIGGPVIANDATSEEVETLMIAVRNQFKILDLRFKILNSPIFIETRNFNDYSKWRNAFEHCGGHPRRRPLLPFRWKDAPGFEYKKHLNFHVDCTDKEKMWERLSKSRQKQIRRAMRSGVEVVEPAEEDVKKWYAILQEMYRQKVKLPLLPMDFFLNAYRSGNAKYLMVKYKGEVIGGLMFEMDEKSVYEWYVCGLDSAYERQYPSVVATYAGMEYANAHGRRCCDLMGAGEPGVPYGVRDFKERFGGQLVEHGRFVCVREPILYKIGVLAVKMMRG